MKSKTLDPLVSALAKNPDDFSAYFDLDNRARAALEKHLDTGAIRREVTAFQLKMRSKYGRELSGPDCTLARLVHSAAELRQREPDEIELNTSETETAGHIHAAV